MRPPPRWKRIWRRICAGPVTRSRAAISPARAAAPAALRTDSPSGYFAPPVTRRCLRVVKANSSRCCLRSNDQNLVFRDTGELGGEQAAWQRTSEHWERYSSASSTPHRATANPALYNPLLAKRDPLACRNAAEIHQSLGDVPRKVSCKWRPTLHPRFYEGFLGIALLSAVEFVRWRSKIKNMAANLKWATRKLMFEAKYSTP